MQITDGRSCTCGHPRVSHEHYRAGTDCASCPPGACRRFRRAGGAASWTRLLAAPFRRGSDRPQRSGPGPLA